MIGRLLAAHTSRSTIGQPETVETLLADLAAGFASPAPLPVDLTETFDETVLVPIPAGDPPAYRVTWEGSDRSATLSVRVAGRWLDLVTVTEEYLRSPAAPAVIAHRLANYRPRGARR